MKKTIKNTFYSKNQAERRKIESTNEFEYIVEEDGLIDESQEDYGVVE